jgi:hypothetical protein
MFVREFDTLGVEVKCFFKFKALQGILFLLRSIITVYEYSHNGLKTGVFSFSPPPTKKLVQENLRLQVLPLTWCLRAPVPDYSLVYA